MDAVITAVRFPLGCVASVFVIIGHLLAFGAETIAVFVSFPFAAVFMSRSDLEASWIGKYPNIIRNGFEIDYSTKISGLVEMLEKIWAWVKVD